MDGALDVIGWGLLIRVVRSLYVDEPAVRHQVDTVRIVVLLEQLPRGGSHPVFVHPLAGVRRVAVRRRGHVACCFQHDVDPAIVLPDMKVLCPCLFAAVLPRIMIVEITQRFTTSGAYLIGQGNYILSRRKCKLSL